MNLIRELTEKLIVSMDERERLQARIGLWGSFAVGIALVFFGILMRIYEFWMPTLIWAVWAFISFAVPILNLRAKRLMSWTSTLYMIASLLAPFMVGLFLGGFARLGYPAYVIVIPVVALIFQRQRVIFWTVASSVMLAISILIEPTLAINPRLPIWLMQLWIAGATISSLWLVSLMTYYFVRQRDLALNLLAIEQEKLRQMAISDPLTGAFNRRHFFERAEHIYQQSLRYQHVLSVLMFDLDNFKKVNDTFGHAAGDMVLQETVRRLQFNIRLVDMLARYGGEEFAVLMPETALESACQAADRLLVCIRSEPISTGQADVQVTASIGVAVSNSLPEETFQQVVERADQALYRAKQLGKNQVVLYDESARS